MLRFLYVILAVLIPLAGCATETAASAPPADSVESDSEEARVCGATALDACHDTNQLIVNDGATTGIYRFLGREPGWYNWKDETAANLAIDFLHGPPDPDEPVHLSDGTTLYGACKPHDCPEGGAILVTPSKIIAIGIVYRPCTNVGKNGHFAPVCEDDMVLRIFVRDPAAKDAAVAALTDWSNKFLETRRRKLGNVIVRLLPAK